MDDGQTGGGLASWSAHRIPTGSPVRYVLDPQDDAAIRLIIGEYDQVEVEMSPAVATAIVATLQEAARAIEDCPALGD
jgi:hypothetical protein